MESEDVPAFVVFAFVVVVWVGWGIWFVVKAYNRTDPWWGRPRRTYTRTRRRQAAGDVNDEQHNAPSAVVLDMDGADYYRAMSDEKRCAVSNSMLVLPARDAVNKATEALLPDNDMRLGSDVRNSSASCA